jgi:hypothetical protein
MEVLKNKTYQIRLFMIWQAGLDKLEQFDWFSEWSESCGPDRFFCHYNKLLIDHAFLVQIRGYWYCKFLYFNGLASGSVY